MSIRIPIIPVDGPLPDKGIRLPSGVLPDASVGMIVSLLVDHKDQRAGQVTYVGDEGVEITYTD
jgi:hypothetical protein